MHTSCLQMYTDSLVFLGMGTHAQAVNIRPLSLPHNLGVRLNPGHPNLIPRMQRLGSTRAQAVNTRPLSLPHDLGMRLNSGCPCLIPKIKGLGMRKDVFRGLFNCNTIQGQQNSGNKARMIAENNSVQAIPASFPHLGWNEDGILRISLSKSVTGKLFSLATVKMASMSTRVHW